MTADRFIERINAKLARRKVKPLLMSHETAIRECFKVLPLMRAVPSAYRVPVCAACGSDAQGNFSVHRDGFGNGPEVPLCDECGCERGPTLDTIWEMIRQRRAFIHELYQEAHAVIDGRKTA